MSKPESGVAQCLSLLLVTGFVALIFGSVWIGFYRSYDPHSVEGKLIATTVTERHQKKNTYYSVQEIFSYPIVKNNVTNFDNCSRATDEYNRESKAWDAAEDVALGTTRWIHVSKSRKDNGCIAEKELHEYWVVGVSMFAYVGFCLVVSTCGVCFFAAQDAVAPMPAGDNSSTPAAHKQTDSYAYTPTNGYGQGYGHAYGHSHGHGHGYAHNHAAIPMQPIAAMQHVPMQLPMHQLQMATAAIGNISFAV